jgi:hypothetical protein
MKAARAEAKLLRHEFEGDQDTDGSVYGITNPAWPGRVKIGWSRDPEKRVKGYNMYSGGEDYVLQFYFHAPGEAAEAACHTVLESKWVRGEWFEVLLEEAEEVVKKICFEHSTSGRNSQ